MFLYVQLIGKIWEEVCNECCLHVAVYMYTFVHVNEVHTVSAEHLSDATKYKSRWFWSVLSQAEFSVPAEG